MLDAMSRDACGSSKTNPRLEDGPTTFEQETAREIQALDQYVYGRWDALAPNASAKGIHTGDISGTRGISGVTWESVCLRFARAWYRIVGKPYEGKPHVRFDEGMQETG